MNYRNQITISKLISKGIINDNTDERFSSLPNGTRVSRTPLVAPCRVSSPQGITRKSAYGNPATTKTKLTRRCSDPMGSTQPLIPPTRVESPRRTAPSRWKSEHSLSDYHQEKVTRRFSGPLLPPRIKTCTPPKDSKQPTFRRKNSPNGATSLFSNVAMPSRKESPAIQSRKVPSPPVGSPLASPVQPRRKLSPPISTQKTQRRSL